MCCLDGTADDGLGDEGRLYRMVREGRRRRYSEVPLARSSLNEGDAFLLDAGTRVYTWYGARASRFGRVARAALEELMDGRKGNIQYFMDVGDDNDEFFELLGGRGEIAPAAEGAAGAVGSEEDDQAKHMVSVASILIFVCTDRPFANNSCATHCSTLYRMRKATSTCTKCRGLGAAWSLTMCS